MLELMFCSLLTIFPDYLFRRYVQGKRLGKEITLYSVWFELRWGITSCLILTILPHHDDFLQSSRPRPASPCSSGPSQFFRRRTDALPRSMSDTPAMSRRERRSSSSTARSSRRPLETARRKIAEVDTDLAAAKLDVRKSDAQIEEAKNSLQQAIDEFETKKYLGSKGARAGARGRASAASCQGPRGDRCGGHGRQGRGAGAGLQLSSLPTRPVPKPRWPRPRWS